MSSVPLAALRLRHPKFEGPLDQYRKVVQLRSLLGHQRLNQQYQQLNQLKLQQEQQRQQGQQEAAALDRQVDDLIANSGGDLRATLPKIRALSPEHWKQWKDWFADYDRKDAEAKMAAIDLGTKRSKQMAVLTQGVYDQASRDAAIQKGLQAQLIDEPTAQRWISMPYDPAKIKALQKSALTTQQVFTHERNRLLDARKAPGEAADTATKEYDFVARTMGPARSQQAWTSRFWRLVILRRRSMSQPGSERFGISPAAHEENRAFPIGTNTASQTCGTPTSCGASSRQFGAAWTA